MNSPNTFAEDCRREVEQAGGDAGLKRLANEFMIASAKYKYTYHFSSLGRPLIQFPQDIVALQEIVWNVRPDLIIETGIAHGGSLIMNASMLALLDYCDAAQSGQPLEPRATRRRVLGIDIDIRPGNRAAIESHPMSHFIEMIEGSSIDPEVVKSVGAIAKQYQRVLVCLDSNHEYQHVLAELVGYAPLVSMDSYCVVFDTSIENSPDALHVNRPWARGNSPMNAVREYLETLQGTAVAASDGIRLRFVADARIDNKLLISTAPNGYLKRTR